jgi:hypothetical protein
MRNSILFLISCLFFVVTQSFQCDRRGGYNSCDVIKNDSVILNVSVMNPNTDYHLYDTIWLNSLVNDVYSPISGSPASFTKATDLLYLTAQAFSINTSGTLPTLYYANIEFNPVVKEGSLSLPGYSGGYIFQYKRTSPDNNLKFGMVAGRTGLYMIELSHGTAIYSPFYIYNSVDFCTTYRGKTTIPLNQQNPSYWNGLGVTSVATGSAYGSHYVAKDQRNYLIFRVIP